MTSTTSNSANPEIANVGFEPKMVPPAAPNNQLVTLGIAVVALILLTQGALYVFRPEMTGRSVTTSPKKLRIIGYVCMTIGLLLLLLAYQR